MKILACDHMIWKNPIDVYQANVKNKMDPEGYSLDNVNIHISRAYFSDHSALTR